MIPSWLFWLSVGLNFALYLYIRYLHAKLEETERRLKYER